MPIAEADLKETVTERGPYQPVIDGLTIFLNRPEPQAKNPELQSEISKADVLYKKLMRKGIETLKEVQVCYQERKGLAASKDLSTLPQRLIDFGVFQERIRVLEDKNIQNLSDCLKIKQFMNLLKVEENPSAELRKDFWTWANSRFSGSSII